MRLVRIDRTKRVCSFCLTPPLRGTLAIETMKSTKGRRRQLVCANCIIEIAEKIKNQGMEDKGDNLIFKKP